MTKAEFDKKAEKVFDDFLKSNLDSLKWVFQLLMSGALVNAAKELFKITLDRGSDGSMSQWVRIYSVLLFALVFLPAFIRFYFGDSRYLDLTFLELRKHKALQYVDTMMALKLSRERRIVDVLITLIHGIIFLALSCCMARPYVFIHVYVLLLFVNCILLSYSLKYSTVRSEIQINGHRFGIIGWLKFFVFRLRSRDLANKPVSEENKTPIFWIINNALAVIVFISIILNFRKHDEYQAVQYILFCLTALLNSIFDLLAERDYYLLDLDSIRAELKSTRHTPQEDESVV